MKIIGRLRAKLGLDAKQFNRGLDRAEGKARGFASRLGRSIAAAGAVMASAVAIGVGAIVRRSLEFIDTQAKTARSIDGTIDALKALQLAGSDAGVAQNTLNKSVQMLTTRLAEAEVKGGVSADALDRLGLSATKLSRLDADERIATIADRVQELGWSSGRTAQFLQDMGVRSKEFSLLLTGGGAAIRAARKEVDDLGLSLSAFDASKVESANDALSRIKLTAEAAGNRFAIAFAPALQTIAEKFTGAMREGAAFRVMIEGIGGSVSRFVALAADIQTIIGGIISSFAGLAAVETRFGSLASIIGAALSPLASLASGVREAIAIFAHLIETTGSFGGAMAALAPLASEVWQRIGAGANYISASVAAMMGRVSAIFTNGIQKLKAKWFGFIGSIAEKINSTFGTNLRTNFDQLIQKTELLRSKTTSGVDAAGFAAQAALAAFKKPLKSLEELRSQVNQTTGEATGGLDASTVAVQNFDSAVQSAGGRSASGLGKIKSAVDGLKSASKGMRDTLKRAFSDIIFNSGKAKDAIKELFKEMGKRAFDKGFDVLFDLGADLFKGKSGGGGGLLKRLFSFDGGGYTGNGLRVGGLDGKGGFLAINHPRETIIDHTKQVGAVAGAGVNGALHVFVHENENLMSAVRVEAEGVAVKVTQANDTRRDQAFAGKVQGVRASAHRRDR